MFRPNQWPFFWILASIIAKNLFFPSAKLILLLVCYFINNLNWLLVSNFELCVELRVVNICYSCVTILYSIVICQHMLHMPDYGN